MIKNYYDINQNKIELVSCNHITKKCEEQLLVLNEYFHESECFRIDKDFNRAIESLKQGYILTFEFTEPSCFKCGKLFRTIIIQSLENIQSELYSFSKGLIAKERFQISLKMTERVLNELKEMSKIPG